MDVILRYPRDELILDKIKTIGMLQKNTASPQLMTTHSATIQMYDSAERIIL